MGTKVFILVILLTGMTCLTSYSQTFDSYQIWTRVAARKQVKKWEFAVDANHRFQSNYLQHHCNPFAYPQATLFRATVSYQVTPTFTIIVSPFLYAQIYRLRMLPTQMAEVEAISQREFRGTGGIQKTFTIHKVQLRMRLLGEFRHFPETSNRMRERLLVSGQYPIWKKDCKKLFALVFNELFYTSTPSSDFMYEQNRSFGGIYYQTGRMLDYQLGYQYTHQKQAQTVFHQSAALLYVIFRL